MMIGVKTMMHDVTQLMIPVRGRHGVNRMTET